MDKKQDAIPDNASVRIKLRLRRVTMRLTSADELATVAGGNSAGECSGHVTGRQV
jgi:hypothetical protein